MSDDLRMLIADNGESDNRNNEHIWNVFAQLLVPLIILMTFAVVMELVQYQKSIDEINKQNYDLQTRINNLGNTAPGILAKRAEVQLIDAQRQKLWASLLQEISERRGPKGLDLDRFFGSADLVNMRGETIDDPRFEALCLKVARDVLGEVKKAEDGTLQPVSGAMERRASKEFTGSVYQQVLKRADLRDPNLPDDDLEMAGRMSPVWPKDQSETLVTDAVVTRDNRQFILEQIAKAASQIRSDLVEIQRGVVVRIYAAYHDDARGQDLARQMEKSTGPSDEPSAEAEKYFDYMQKKVREALGRNYYFLNATWSPVNRL
jgi:hypothetical protein